MSRNATTAVTIAYRVRHPLSQAGGWMPLRIVAAPAHSMTNPSANPVWNVKYVQYSDRLHAS